MRKRIVVLLLAGVLLGSQIAVDAAAAEVTQNHTEAVLQTGMEPDDPVQGTETETVNDQKENDPQTDPFPEKPAEGEADGEDTPNVGNAPADIPETVRPEDSQREESPAVDITDESEADAGSAGADIAKPETPEKEEPKEEADKPQSIAVDSGNTPAVISYSFSLKYVSPAANKVGGVPFADILEKTSEYICKQEGNYDSVNPNDNGALSIGCIQWHASRALELMRSIVAKNPANAKKILGDKLYKEITKSSTTWGSRTLSSSEAAVFKKLLGTAESKAAQQELRKSDLTGYLNHGIKCGIRNAPALVYFADIENQGGYSRSENCAKFAKNLTGNMNTVTLNELHIATICEAFSLVGSSKFFSDDSNRTLYLKRRRTTYGYAAGLGWAFCRSGDCIIPYGTPSKSPYTGTEWLQKALNSVQKAGLTVNGKYDSATAKAVKNYQSAHGLKADGDAGIDTTCDLILTLYYKAATGKGSAPHVGNASAAAAASSEPAAAKITVSKSSYAVNDNSGKFSIGAKSNYSDAKLTYKTSNKAVATVSSAGKVTIKKAGSATVTVSQAATGKHKAVSKKVKITVYSTSPSSYKVPTATLGKGRKNAKSSVQWVQAALTKLGYSKEVIDGIWDSTTLHNVKSFQRSAKLSADGSVGSSTRTAIRNLINVKTKKLKATAKGGNKKITVSWSKVSGASKYYIYRKKKGGSWSRIKTISSAKTVKYTDKSAKKGTKYYYCVRAYRKTGSIAVKSSYKSSALVKRKK